MPVVITSDRGVQFTSAIWQILCKTLRIKCVVTTAYHPQSNGLVECFHRQLKNALKSRACRVDWAEHLPWVMLGIRAAPKEDSAVSAAETVYVRFTSLSSRSATHSRRPTCRAGRAFLDSRSCGPGVLGTQARGNAIFFKARGHAEREEVGTLFSRA